MYVCERNGPVYSGVSEGERTRRREGREEEEVGMRQRKKMMYNGVLMTHTE